MKTRIHCRLVSITLIAIFLPTTFSIAQWWTEWAKSGVNPVVAPSMVTWFDNACCPSVVFEDGVYRMWFTGWTADDIHRNIGYAESVNGLDWDINSEPVLTCNEPNAWNRNKYLGTVIRTDDTLRMYYSGFNTFSPFTPCIGYAWSLDGIAWTCLPQAILPRGEAGEWDENLVENPMVIVEDELYHMWYDNGTAIGHATSLDGIAWEKDVTHNPVMYAGIPGSHYETAIYAGPLMTSDGLTHMLFGGLAADNTGATGHAGSDNLYGWTITEGPVLTGDPGAWDAASALINAVLPGNGMMLAWYTGSSSLEEPQYAIGLAMAEIVRIPDFLSNTVETVRPYPNPFTTDVFLATGSLAESPVRIDILSSNGQVVASQTTGSAGKNDPEIRIPAVTWPSGMYVAIIHTPSGIHHCKLLKH